MLRPQKNLKTSPNLSDHPPSRRWEDLDVDCLANVFARAGMESLVLAVPFVCKSWYAATLNPLCWESLSFPDFEHYALFVAGDDTDVELKSFIEFYDKFVEDYRIDRARFSITGFIKFVVDQSEGKAQMLKLPGFCTEEGLRHAAEGCPGIRFLNFADDLVLFKHSQILPEVIGKWKLLEHLTLGGNMLNIMKQYWENRGKKHLRREIEEELLWLDNVSVDSNKNLLEILVQVGIHCKRMRTLHIYHACVGEHEASAIVNGLPNLVVLTLEQCRIETKNLVITIWEGCKKLSCFDVCNCEGFKVDGEELRKLGSHIERFRCTLDLTFF